MWTPVGRHLLAFHIAHSLFRETSPPRVNFLHAHRKDTDIAAEMRAGHDCWQVSCGHDVVGILSLAFRKTFGGRSGGGVAIDILERCLRLAYESAYLRETRLFQSLMKWEQRHGGLPILKRS